MKSSINTKFRTLVLVAGLAAGFSAHASSTVIFDPAGNSANTSTDVAFTTFDQRPGNAIALGASASSTAGTQFNLVYQSNLGSALDQNGDAVFNQGAVVGGAARNFTFTAGFSEIVTSNTIQAGNGVLTFGFDPANSNSVSATNFFYMYAPGVSGDNLAGTGFAVGTPILTGHFIASNYASTFTATGNNGQALDQAGGDNYGGVTTINGAGSTVATLVIDSFSTAYFPNLVVGATSSLINTSQNLAFAQVDPSAQFDPDGVAGGALIAGVGSVGTNNGTSTSNTMFQADANQSFTTTAVPEPMPTALIGLGLVALVMVRRKTAQKN
jgi:hypothetical protein